VGSVWLCAVDVDHFKRVNDGLGHQVGDDLLREVAGRLRTVLGDAVFRVGGDEFVAVRETPGEEDPAVVAQAALSAFDHPVEAGGRELAVTVSLGLAPLSGVRSGAVALRHADLALYRAKELGRARWAAYSEELQQRADARLELQHELARAIDHGELVVHYRPVVDLIDGAAAGAQALLRWRSGRHGLLTPRQFLDAAVEGGLLARLDRVVFDDMTVALRICAQDPLVRPGGRPLWVSTRLTAEELTHPALAPLVRDVVAAVGGDGSRLRIEVGEDVVVDPAATDALDELRDAGVHLVVADFGTGPSSLLRLDRYPADTIKLDRSFVEGLGRRRRDTAVVTEIARLAGELGLEVAADGLTEPFQAELLRDLGVRFAQGRLVGPAAPRATLLDAVLGEGARR
jgi:diguanylate cyclase (GGDEF)-like protein